ncbi:PASTA domain-containing protein, partial [Frankia tisae]|uniref:PASTA domain-containing protein n=1 Tax=Frankia tisae TaxID=2950104 RepID=UPI0021BECBF7
PSRTDDYWSGPPDRGGFAARPAAPPPPPPPGKTGLSRNAKIGIGSAAVVVLLGIGAALGGGGSTATTTASAVVPAPVASAPPVTGVPPVTSGAPAAGGSIAAGAVAPVASTTPAPRRAVPNVVGLNHQTAQDTLQAAGFYNLAEQDGTGQGRMLVLDRNWHVIAQAPGPGTVISTDGQVMLTSKKYTDP